MEGGHKANCLHTSKPLRLNPAKAGGVWDGCTMTMITIGKISAQKHLSQEDALESTSVRQSIRTKSRLYTIHPESTGSEGRMAELRPSLAEKTPLTGAC